MSDPLGLVFKALADPTRRIILAELAKRDEQSLFEICVRLTEGHGISFARQTISKHLDVLEEAGLVQTRWQGRTKQHSRNLTQATQLISAWLKNAKGSAGSLSAASSTETGQVS